MSNESFSSYGPSVVDMHSPETGKSPILDMIEFINDLEKIGIPTMTSSNSLVAV